MSARNAMTHRCDVQRDASRGDGGNDWGGDPAPDWQTHLDELHCRFWFESGQTIYDGTKAVELTTRKLIVPWGTDITEDDRIVSVRDRRNRELADGPMRVDTVGNRDGHLVLSLVEDR